MDRTDDGQDGNTPPGGAATSDGSASGAPRIRITTPHREPHVVMRDLRDYWRSLCQGRAIPDRAAIEPRGIAAGLDYAFILERIAPGAARFRLTGKHLLDLMGMEVRGMPLCSVIEPDHRGRFSDVLETVFRAPQIAELSLHSAPGYGRPALSAGMLLLPLRSDLGDVTRALGCLVAGGLIGRAPRRFEITAERIDPVIDGARILEPRPSAHDLEDVPANWRPLTRKPTQRPLSDRLPDADQMADKGNAQPSVQAPPLSPAERRAQFRVIRSDDNG